MLKHKAVFDQVTLVNYNNIKPKTKLVKQINHQEIKNLTRRMQENANSCEEIYQEIILLETVNPYLVSIQEKWKKSGEALSK